LKKKPTKPFQNLCGLPSKLETSESQRKRVRLLLKNKNCRGGISDELNRGKPPLRDLKKK